jgi:hypothetical protein
MVMNGTQRCLRVFFDLCVEYKSKGEGTNGQIEEEEQARKKKRS